MTFKRLDYRQKITNLYYKHTGRQFQYNVYNTIKKDIGIVPPRRVFVLVFIACFPLGDLFLSKLSNAASLHFTRSLCTCVHAAPCAAITVISHQSEAAEPHIDIPDCLPASLAKIDM